MANNQPVPQEIPGAYGRLTRPMTWANHGEASEDVKELRLRFERMSATLQQLEYALNARSRVDWHNDTVQQRKQVVLRLMPRLMQ